MNINRIHSSSLPDHLKKYVSDNNNNNEEDIINQERKKKKKKSSDDSSNIRYAQVKKSKIVDVNDQESLLPPDTDYQNKKKQREKDEYKPTIENIDDYSGTLDKDELFKDDGDQKDDKSGYKQVGSWTTTNLSPPKTNRDLSPPRNRGRTMERDLSPPRNRGKTIEKDLSPPRNRNNSRQEERQQDLSPPRNRGREIERDLSPPRNINNKRVSRFDQQPNNNQDLSPPRNNSSKQQRQEDLSPPRNRGRTMERDLSPPRNRNNSSRNVESDLSPPRNRGRAIERDDDLSPPRNNSKVDKTPPMSRDRDRSSTPPPLPSSSPTIGLNQKLKMSFGGDAGLHSGRSIREQAEKRVQEQKDLFQRADRNLLGRDAETVYRDKRGSKVDRATLELEARQKQEIDQEKDMEWGRGRVQKQQREEELKRLENEKLKPFSRYADDSDLNDHQKDIGRWGDPMSMMSSSSSKKSKKDKKIKKDELPLYQGSISSNRYNIRPGYRWDGVDRSNGFEKDLFKHQNSKSAMKQKAYLWSVEDM